MSQNKIDILERALKREKLARKTAEKILEKKSRELYFLSNELKETNEKLEDLLDQKSSQLKGFFNNTQDAFIIIDLKGNVLEMNNTAINLIEHDLKEGSLNVLDLMDEEEKELGIKSFGELIKQGDFSGYTTKIKTKSNKILWVHINGSLIYNKKKEPIAAQGIIRNITEIKKYTALIEEQKRQLEIVVESSSLGIVLTQSGDILMTNKSFQDQLGYSEEELLNMSVKDVSFKEDYLVTKNHLEKMDARLINNFIIDKRYIKKNGGILLAKTNVNAVRDQYGKVKYEVAIIEDVTLEREKTLVIDMVNDVVKSILGKLDIYDIALEIINKIAKYLQAKNSVIYFVNHKNNTVEQIAINNENLEEKNQLINSVILPIGKGIIGDVAKTGKAEIVKDTLKDSRYIVLNEKKAFSKIAVPIVSDGKVIAIIASEYEEKNYYNKEHKKTLENIASLVALQLKSAFNLIARNKIEVKNTELLNELEKSNSELQEYAHIVSHDLKSPLRSLEALITWIKEDNLEKFDETSIQNFDLVEATLEKMEKLISDILLYSSVDSVKENKEKIDLNIVITDLKQVIFIPENIEIKTINKLPIIYGDKMKFQQLFQNLICNAIKFNDKEKGLIEINVLDKKSFYQFSVKDNGIGIEKKHHEKIFKIFQSLKASSKSSGIGLSIVKKVVDFYEGEIWLESELNKGTTFSFTIRK